MYETEKYISQSHICIFLSSMMVGDAISLKKKIILIKSLYLSNFYHLRSVMLNKEIKLFEINVDINNYKLMDEKQLNYELNHKSVSLLIHEFIISFSSINQTLGKPRTHNDKLGTC